MEFIKKIAAQTDCKVKSIRTDNAKEYDNEELQKFLKDNGIVHEKSALYCQYMNGKAERTIQTINNRIGCALAQAGAKKGYWAEAGTYMLIVENVLIEEGVHKEVYKKLFLSTKIFEKIKTWGCAAIWHIPKEQRKKFNEKGEKCTFLGLDQGGFRLFRAKDNFLYTSLCTPSSINAFSTIDM